MELDAKVKEYRVMVGKVPDDKQLALITSGFLDLATLDRMRNENIDKKDYSSTKKRITERREEMIGITRHVVQPKASTRMAVDALEGQHSQSEDPMAQSHNDPWYNGGEAMAPPGLDANMALDYANRRQKGQQKGGGAPPPGGKRPLDCWKCGGLGASRPVMHIAGRIKGQ